MLVVIYFISVCILFCVYEMIEKTIPIAVLRTSDKTRLYYNRAVAQRHRRKEGNVLFNDAPNTFYLRLYGVRHMVKDHSDSERGNPLRPLFPISSKDSFICIIPQTG